MKWSLPLALLFAGCMGPYPGNNETDGSDGTDGTDGTDDTDGPLFEPKVMLLVPGSDSDAGWTRSHASAVNALGDSLDIDTQVQYLVANADAADVLAAGDEDGYNVYITASSGYITSSVTHSANAPETRTLSCCGSQATPNLTSYFGRIYQPLYVSGYVAATKSCTGRIGVVAAFPNPQFIRHINAFTLGARRANPEVTVEVTWLNSFFDLGRERSLAEELVAHGNDVLLVQTNTNIPVDVSRNSTVTCDDGGGPEASPVFSVGYHAADMCDAAPERCLTSAYWNWQPYYESQIESMVDGTFDPTNTSWQPWLPNDDSVVKLLPWQGDASKDNYVPGDVAGTADSLANDLRNADPSAPFDGAFNGGVIRSSFRATMVRSSQSLTDEELDDMCWFVDGVVYWSDEDNDWIPAAVPEADCPGTTFDPNVR
ncbi:MAG: BMP family ABC transporter substrate-binding protein [Myxococcota bacterium]